MTNAEKNYYINKEYEGYYSGYGGIEIKEIQYGIEDYVVFVANAWYGKKSVHKAKIYYNSDSTYFKFAGHRIKFSECLRRCV